MADERHYIHIHGAVFIALGAADTLPAGGFDGYKTGGCRDFHNEGNRTSYFAKSPLVFENEGHWDGKQVVYYVAGKHPKHFSFL